MSCESNEDYKYKILQRQTELLRQRAIIDTLIKPVEVILDKQLLDAKVKCLGDGMCENFEEYEKFSEKQFTKKELKDTVLTVECYFLRSGCTGYEGNIRINLDTLILKLESNTNTSCTEIEYYKVIYKINNPKRKKYIIAKE
jgi:hypothetical protein